MIWLTLCINSNLNVKVDLKIFTDSRPLLESLESTSQMGEKALSHSEAYLKQCLEDGEVTTYSWLERKDMIVDILTKQGSKHDKLHNVIERNIFQNVPDERNMEKYKTGRSK